MKVSVYSAQKLFPRILPLRRILPPLVLAALALLFLSGAGGNETLTVYVTNSGTRYHLDGCYNLRRSKIAVSLADAAMSGYVPCSVCGAPALPVLSAENGPDARRNELYRVNGTGLANSFEADISRMVPAEVIDHVDGDTIRVRIVNPPAGLGVVETVRLLGVDTPETVHPNMPVQAFGREASDFTGARLSGRNVYLAFDWDLRDHYGRLLAYIYTEDGRCFNAVLVKEGYSFAYTRYTFQFMDEFRSLEREARNQKRGLWGN